MLLQTVSKAKTVTKIELKSKNTPHVCLTNMTKMCTRYNLMIERYNK